MKFSSRLFIYLFLFFLINLGKASGYNYLDLALSFKESGEYEKAIEILKTSKDTIPKDTFSRYLGKLEFLSGNPQVGLGYFREIKEKLWSDFVYLGLIYEDLGEIDLAIKNYRKSNFLRKNAISLFRLGKIYRLRNQFSQAVKIFSKLIDFDSSFRLAYYYLGDCLQAQRKYQKAYKFLSRAAAFYPQDKGIGEKFKALKEKLGRDFFLTRKKQAERKRKKVKLPPYTLKPSLPEVKVGLALNLKEFSLSSSGDFQISAKNRTFTGKANKFYRVVFKNKAIILSDPDSSLKYGVFELPVEFSSLETAGKKFPFYVLDLPYRGDLEVVSGAKGLTLINRLSLEEYLYGVLSAEIPAWAHKEALRAQSIAARSFAYGKLGRHKSEKFDLCPDVHCQVYRGLSAETFSTKLAIDKTKGKVLVYQNQPIEALYHSNCGGCLSTDTFGQIEYLENKIDAKELSLPESAYAEDLWFFHQPLTFSSSQASDFRWQRIYDQEDFNLIFGTSLDNLKAILPKAKGQCFRYKEIEIISSGGNKKLKGDLNIRNYFDRLRSSSFKLEIKSSKAKKTQMLIFWGSGFGHGVGLSQKGAMKMAQEGYSYQNILKHYYPKTEIKELY
jgi:stage II sporulation protein D